MQYIFILYLFSKERYNCDAYQLYKNKKNYRCIKYTICMMQIIYFLGELLKPVHVYVCVWNQNKCNL